MAVRDREITVEHWGGYTIVHIGGQKYEFDSDEEAEIVLANEWGLTPLDLYWHFGGQTHEQSADSSD